jgi:hypothetical protein
MLLRWEASLWITHSSFILFVFNQWYWHSYYCFSIQNNNDNNSINSRKKKRMMNEKNRGREEDEEKQMNLEQQKGEMLDDVNNEGGRRIKRIKKKKRINEDDDNKFGQDTIVGIINVPEDVFMFHIVGNLNQKEEVVSGLSETNKLFSILIRDRYQDIPCWGHWRALYSREGWIWYMPLSPLWDPSSNHFHHEEQLCNRKE